MLLIGTGITGEYTGRLSGNVRNRPLYITKEANNPAADLFCFEFTCRIFIKHFSELNCGRILLKTDLFRSWLVPDTGPEPRFLNL